MHRHDADGGGAQKGDESPHESCEGLVHIWIKRSGSIVSNPAAECNGGFLGESAECRT
jgi:hypothetical protein